MQSYYQEILELRLVSGNVRAEADSCDKEKDTGSNNNVDTETVIARAANKVQLRVDRKNNIVVCRSVSGWSGTNYHSL